MKKLLLVTALLSLATVRITAQQYTGLEGLLHCPSADMHGKGTGRISLAHLDRNTMPEHYSSDITAYSLAYSPFDWAEISFTGLVRNVGGIVYQDRMTSVKFRPLKEGGWWPSVVVGSNDPLSTIKSSADDEENNHMCNVYIALSKHYDINIGTLGLHAAYRRFRKTVNDKWNGAVGGLTFSPCFFPEARIVGEYDGNGFNAGADVKLFKHISLQAICYEMKYFNCGICFEANL